MFRKPMRLEKWIAFDGASFGDILSEIYGENDYISEIDEEKLSALLRMEESQGARDEAVLASDSDIHGEASEEDSDAAIAADSSASASEKSTGYESDDEGPDSGSGALIREVGEALSDTREQCGDLERCMSRLYGEYAAFDRQQWSEPARERLKDIFEAGNAMKKNLSQLGQSLERQTEFLLNTPQERREGLLREGVHDLANTTATLAGEAEILATAMDKTAEYLRDVNNADDRPPGEGELSAFFDRVYNEALLDWHAKTSLRDPMGRELERYESLREGQPPPE